MKMESKQKYWKIKVKINVYLLFINSPQNQILPQREFESQLIDSDTLCVI